MGSTGRLLSFRGDAGASDSMDERYRNRVRGNKHLSDAAATSADQADQAHSARGEQSRTRWLGDERDRPRIGPVDRLGRHACAGDRPGQGRLSRGPCKCSSSTCDHKVNRECGGSMTAGCSVAGTGTTLNDNRTTTSWVMPASQSVDFRRRGDWNCNQQATIVAPPQKIE